MSRLAAKPIKISERISLSNKDCQLGFVLEDKEMTIRIPELILIKVDINKIYIDRKNDTKQARSLQGLVARMIQNINDDLINGVTKELEIIGTGYRVSKKDGSLSLAVGFSNNIEIMIPEDIEVTITKNSIKVCGFDRQKVGQYAAKIRMIKPPEVYKGKGIRYKNEFVKKKDGKAAQAVGSG